VPEAIGDGAVLQGRRGLSANVDRVGRGPAPRAVGNVAVPFAEMASVSPASVSSTSPVPVKPATVTLSRDCAVQENRDVSFTAAPLHHAGGV